MIEATTLRLTKLLKKREPDLFIEKAGFKLVDVTSDIIHPRILIMTDSRAVNSAPSITRLVDYEAFPFSIDSVDLSFELDPMHSGDSIIGRRIVRVNMHSS